MRISEFWEEKAELESIRYEQETITWAENRAQKEWMTKKNLGEGDNQAKSINNIFIK